MLPTESAGQIRVYLLFTLLIATNRGQIDTFLFGFNVKPHPTFLSSLPPPLQAQTLQHLPCARPGLGTGDTKGNQKTISTFEEHTS